LVKATAPTSADLTKIGSDAAYKAPIISAVETHTSGKNPFFPFGGCQFKS
jgi:uncharacterized ParB-like nuclease family protein